MPAGRRSGRRGEASGVLTGRLRVHDPFELIRWLALSQPDPRKALAELVQNSLDAGARSVRVLRIRERGVACLRVRDDGEGVIPELDRPEALRYIATHVGHSRKRQLSPEQRLALMTQGQYGIGLLGFWSLGHTLEMRTSIPGQRPHRLILYRDSPDYLIEPLRGRLPFGERYTEIVVTHLHREALAALLASRAADYLAAELRGQLLAREVELVIEDRISRGRAPKRVAVRPPRFLGERLEGIGPLEIPGHPPVRMEIYLAGEGDGEGEGRGLSLYAAGTLVAERFDELEALGLARAPWTDPRLTGLVEFPALQVPPGSRRGVIPDAAASAFAKALQSVEPVLEALLEAHERRRSEALDRSLIRDLQRAFRDFYRQRPRYTMLPVKPEGEGAAAEGPLGGEGLAASRSGAGEAESAEGSLEADESAEVEPVETPPPELFPPGPLADLRVEPRSLRLGCGEARRLRAVGLDAHGREVADPLACAWIVEGEIGTIECEGAAPVARFVACAEPAIGRVLVAATSAGAKAHAAIEVAVLDRVPDARSDEGIPEPELVDLPVAPWRSRIVEGRWQVNAGHRDYRAVAERPALKLRYLALLFAKEVVLRSHQDPRLEAPLEQLVEVAAYADGRLAERRGRRPGAQNGVRARGAPADG